MDLRLKRLLPTKESLANNRWLRWLGPGLLHPRLWHFSRRGVAVGVALGIFFGLLIPLGQIPLAAGAAILLRGNVPAAIGSTLVTNPVTFAPVYLLAHRLGSALLDADEPPPPLALAEEAPPPAGEPWWDTVKNRIVSLGKPLLLGLTLIATGAGLTVYFVILLGWRLRTVWAWRQRRKGRIAQGVSPREDGKSA